MFDAHVNLHAEAFDDDRDAVIARAREAGVRGMLCICDRLDSVEAIKRLTAPHDDMWRTVGVHPHHAKDHSALSAADLLALAEELDVVAIGECGLDFHYGYSARDDQVSVFEAHIEAGRRSGLPLVIHSRDADTLTREMLDANDTGPLLLHCYTGGLELLDAALGKGAYVSVTGIFTFKSAREVRSVLERVPLDRLLIETDCPYLAPVPMRGRRNEPAFLVHVAAALAEARGVSTEELAARTSENARRLFTRIGSAL